MKTYLVKTNKGEKKVRASDRGDAGFNYNLSVGERIKKVTLI